MNARTIDASRREVMRTVSEFWHESEDQRDYDGEAVYRVDAPNSFQSRFLETISENWEEAEDGDYQSESKGSESLFQITKEIAEDAGILPVVSRTNAKWLILGLCVVAGAYFAISYFTYQQHYVAKASLLYRPIEDKYKMHYESPTIQTWQGMVTSRPVMEQIKKRHQIPMSAGQLSKLFNVVQPPNTTQLILNFQWKDQQQAQEILESTVELFRQRVTDVRRATVCERITDMQTALQNLRAEREAKTTKMEKRLKGLPVGDIADTLAGWDKDRMTIMQNVADDRIVLAGLEAEVTALNDKLAAERAKAKEEWERDRQAIMKKEGMADNQRRLEEIRKKRIAMQRDMKIRAQLDDYYRRRDKMAALVDKGIRKQAELDDINEQIAALEESSNVAPEILELQKRAKALQELLIPDSNADAQAPEPVTTKSIKDKLFNKDLEIRQYKAKIQKQLSDIETLNERYQLAASLKPEILRFESELRQVLDKQNLIDANLQQLQLIESFGNVEFIYFSEPYVEEKPQWETAFTSSN